MSIPFSPEALARWPQAVAWLVAVGLLLAGWFSPWFGLLVLVVVSLIEIRLLLDWCDDRLQVLGERPGISRRELRRFRLRSRLTTTLAFAAVSYTVFLLISPNVWFGSAYTKAIHVRVAVPLDFLIYGVCAAFFISLRWSSEARSLRPWRESFTGPARNGVDLFVRLFSLPDWEVPGQAWTWSVVIVVGWSVALVGFSAAAVDAKPASWPTANAKVSGGGSSAGEGNGGGRANPGENLGSGTASGRQATTTTSPETTTSSTSPTYANRACGSTEIKQVLGKDLYPTLAPGVQA
ncbi:MAG: hypothetical protein ACREP9_00625, partial [Candidatus Dormibacteraceae bacterium]